MESLKIKFSKKIWGQLVECAINLGSEKASKLTNGGLVLLSKFQVNRLVEHFEELRMIKWEELQNDKYKITRFNHHFFIALK